jgi:hypothetical protein
MTAFEAKRSRGIGHMLMIPFQFRQQRFAFERFRTLPERSIRRQR